MNPVLVAGTNSWSPGHAADWYCPGQPYGKFLAQQGVTPLYDGDQPFIWSTSLSGVPFLSRNQADWAAGGAALAYFIIAKQWIRGEATALVAHSHGLQVVLYACADHNLKVQTLISVGSPVREDMMEVARRARPNIKYWLHLHSDGSDKWQWYGELFDGNWKDWFRGDRIVREHPLADKNDFVPGVGHSDLLRDPQRFHFWLDRGWIDPLKG